MNKGDKLQNQLRDGFYPQLKPMQKGSIGSIIRQQLKRAFILFLWM